jgi:cardiolipin synthase
VQVYRDGHEALAVLEQLIDSAQCRIDVIMYVWEEDEEVGFGIARRLAAAAAAKRRVRVLVDGGANLIFAPTPSSESPFDHRKLVLIDGQCAWAGGRNFTHPAFFVRHDFSLTMQGPLVAQWQTMFENYWRDQGGKPACIQANPTGMPDLPANAAARLVASGPTEHSLRTALYHAIDRARGSIYLENPYLTDNGVIVKLARARRRGVDVRILFTIQSDSASINHTNKVTANRFLAAGVRVYLYPGRVHTKAALIDGTWAYMGSGNFDLLSLHRNHELGIVFGPCPFLAELEQILFQPDFNPDWELHAPLSLTAADRAYEMLAAFFL